MHNKIKLFLDFDDTITLSAKQFVKIANKKFNTNKDWRDVKKWNFIDLYPNITYEDIDSIFCSKDFFVDLEIIDDVLKCLNDIKNSIDINIVTIGKPRNLENKKIWLSENFKNIKYNFVGITETFNINKSSIDMKNGIFIDDRFNMLQSSNAPTKILFKNFNSFEWQEHDPGSNVYIVNTWDEIHDMLKFYLNHNNFLKDDLYV